MGILISGWRKEMTVECRIDITHLLFLLSGRFKKHFTNAHLLHQMYFGCRAPIQNCWSNVFFFSIVVTVLSKSNKTQVVTVWTHWALCQRVRRLNESWNSELQTLDSGAKKIAMTSHNGTFKKGSFIQKQKVIKKWPTFVNVKFGFFSPILHNSSGKR